VAKNREETGAWPSGQRAERNCPTFENTVDLDCTTQIR
jgi:hypothetical protein